MTEEFAYEPKRETSALGQVEVRTQIEEPLAKEVFCRESLEGNGRILCDIMIPDEPVVGLENGING